MSQLDASIAKRFDITVKQNQTFDAILTFLDSDGEPVALSGIAKMSVRKEDCCGGCDCDNEIRNTPFDLIYKQDFSPSITGLNSNQLAFEDLIILSPGNYKYDLLIEFQNGYREYFLFGTFKVKKSYTAI